jgi:hypothetical protein
MKERIYVVRGPNTTHLVNAPSKASAIAFIADSQFTADVASQMDLVNLLTEGFKVEFARVSNLDLELGDK